MTDTPSDEALARRVQEGNTDAFGTLIERYEPKLKRYGTKFLASGTVSVAGWVGAATCGLLLG